MLSGQDLIEHIQELIKNSQSGEALMALRRGVEINHTLIENPSVYFSLAKLYSQINIKSKNKLKIVLGGEQSLDHVGQLLKFFLGLWEFDVEIYISAFGTFDNEIHNPQSELYRFQPDIIWIFSGFRDTWFTTAEEALSYTRQRWDVIHKYSHAHIIQNNIDLPAERPRGHIEVISKDLPSVEMGHFNNQLASLKMPGISIFDLDWVSSLIGKYAWSDDRLWFHSKHGISPSALPLLTYHGARFIEALQGRAKRVLILDLDNTLWGGVLGDDGVDGIQIGLGEPQGEAYYHFQKYLAALKESGILLVICSKNEEVFVREAFRQHADMPLKWKDFAAVVANWENKPRNIQTLAETLGLDPSCFVFIDDQPAERAFVRQEFPTLAVPELPEDPSQYQRVLDSYRYFETATLTEEDHHRTEMYQQLSKVNSQLRTHPNLDEFLKSLAMRSHHSEFDRAHLQRITQLINKSNQFNLTGLRMKEAEVVAMMGNPQIYTQYFNLQDKFTDHGLVALVMLEKRDQELFILNWLMSCRILGRGLEKFVQNWIYKTAKQIGVAQIRGRYVPSGRNKLVEKHYPNLGYSAIPAQFPEDNEWYLDLNSTVQTQTVYIQDQP